MFLKIIATIIFFSIVSEEAIPEEGTITYKKCKEVPEINVCPNRCPPSFIYLNEGCYHFSPIQTSWFEAAQLCRAMNAHLVSIESKEEDAALVHYITNSFGDKYFWWTSGSDIVVEGNFVWAATGHLVGYTNWCKPQPDNAGGNENCLHYLGGCWNDFVCHLKTALSKPIHFICEIL